MFDPDKSDSRKREHSLLAFGSAARREPAASKAVSLLAVADAVGQEDPVLRHRFARSRREAEAGPVENPAVETATPDAPAKAEAANASATSADRASWSLAKLMPGWLSPKAENRNEAPAAMEWPGAISDTGFAPGDQHVGPPAERPPDLYWKPLVDPMVVVGGVAKSKLLIAATTLLGAVLGVAIALSTPKQFEASAELLVDPRDLRIVDGELTQSGLPSDATLAIVENQVRVLTSGTVLNKVVDKLNLENDPEFNGEADAGLGIGDIISVVRSIVSRQDGAGQGDRRRSLAIGNLGRSLTVSRGGKTFVIVISVLTRDGEKSALIANTMTDVFLETYGEIQSSAAGRAEGEITSRLDELRSGVETAERNVETFKAENDIIDPQGRLITDDEIVSLNGQLSVARARTLELNARASTARAVDVDSVLGGTLPEQIASGALAELRAQYATLKQEADRQAVQLGPRHPQRMAVESQLAGARERIGAELRRIVSSLQVELKRAVELEQQLAARLAQLKVQQGGLGAAMVTLRELEREATAKRDVYEKFLLRAKETGEQKDVNSANMSVITPAYPPLDPTGPSRATIALTGLVLGFVSGVGLGGMRGAYEGLRQNVGVPQRRRKWKRWRSEQDLAAAPRDPSAIPILPGRNEADLRAEALVRTVSDANADQAPAGPEEPASRIASMNPEAAKAAQPMDVPMTDPYAPQYAPTPPHLTYPPLPAYPPVYQGAYAPAQMPPAYAHPQMPAQPIYPPHYAQPVQGQPYPFAPAPYGYPQAQPPLYPTWQPQAGAPVPYYPQPMPAPNPQAYAAAPQQPMAQAVAPASAESVRQETRRAENQSQIDEIRESLREFRDAVRDFTESRSRRKFF